MNVRSALEANAKTPETMEPRMSPLYDPAGFAQSAAVRLAAPRYFSCNAGSMQPTAVFVVIVASVALNDARFREWSAAFSAYRRDGINQCMKLSHIVAVGASQDDRERDTLRFGNEVVLGTGSRAVSGIGSRF